MYFNCTFFTSMCIFYLKSSKRAAFEYLWTDYSNSAIDCRHLYIITPIYGDNDTNSGSGEKVVKTTSTEQRTRYATQAVSVIWIKQKKRR